MENQQDEMMNMNIDGGAVNNNNGVKMSSVTNNNNSNNYLCRQSSTRWTPTTEQIKLLKELYYTNGVRSPSADQIQTICARLRRYGKIEGKNVFYWFQNHKARERQKKRLTPNATSSSTVTTTTPQFNITNNNSNFIRNGGLNWIPADHQDFTLHAKYPCTVNNPGVSCSSSSAGVISGGGQLTESFNYGAVTMEYKFRDCSISGGVLNGGNQLNQWSTAVGTNYNPYAPATYSNFLIDNHKISTMEEDPYIDQNQESQEIETLPLFPMHNEEHDHDHSFYYIKSESDGGYYNDRNRWPSNGSNGHTSLELSLNSYGYGCYSHHL